MKCKNEKTSQNKAKQNNKQKETNKQIVPLLWLIMEVPVCGLTLARTRDEGGGYHPPLAFFFKFYRVDSGHLSFSVAVRLSLRHIFGLL